MMTNDRYFPIFIPSYHRADNLKTAAFFIKKIGWPSNQVHVFIDSETDDKCEYENTCNMLGCCLHVFDMSEARARYDFVHRASKSRRAAGMARNMFFDFAIQNKIDFYMVQDDDTQRYDMRARGEKDKAAKKCQVVRTFFAVQEPTKRHQIGLFRIGQGGDFLCRPTGRIYQEKVMNTTFYLMPYIYRGERGVQDNDTSLFCSVKNEGLFCGSTRDGVVLIQMPSAKQKGGLTDLYNECKLLNKSLVVPIQYPSAVYAEKQQRNGGRLHHKIVYRNLSPRIIKFPQGRGNIRWDTFEEDWPFTNEPKKRNYKLL